MRGVVAAGHPVTAEAGADVLRAGGNAVDAAVGAVLVSFASESLLTGPGAGGFMLLTSPTGRSHLLDFFVATPGQGLADPDPAPLVPVEVAFSPEAIQIFNVGASSCGAYGMPAGLAYALERYGTLGLGDLTPAAARAAREGVEVSPIQEYLLRILGPIFRSTAEGTALYEPAGPPGGGRRAAADARAGRPAGPAGGRGPGLPLRRRRGRGVQRVGARARRPADDRRIWPATR